MLSLYLGCMEGVYDASSQVCGDVSILDITDYFPVPSLSSSLLSFVVVSMVPTPTLVQTSESSLCVVTVFVGSLQVLLHIGRTDNHPRRYRIRTISFPTYV